ncbi:MAG: chemotaxis protein CheA [Candidatus Methylomirabilales bacterium]
MDADYEAVLRTYQVESEEQLGQMEEALIALETRPEDEETLEAIFRVAHTLKGNASSFGFPRVAELAHAIEDVLEHLRNRTLPVTGGLMSLLLRAVDALRQMVPDAVAGVEQTQPVYATLLRQLAEKGATAAEAEEKEEIANLAAMERRKRPFGRRREDIQAWMDCTRTLRVNIEKLDRMLNLSGEIAIARGRLTEMLAREVGRTEIQDACRVLNALSMELQEQIMKVRMVPVGPAFRQHIRTVRDVAQAHGKVARLVIEGGDVEVDTTVVEHLKDPLAHMIRNAVDHGIEPPGLRKAEGKDPCGCLTLRAYHEAGGIVIQVADDGAGLNRERIVERARSLELVAEPEKLTKAEVYRLVFEPGFSTADTVTDLSGRGVGMDVVRRSIEALRGSVAIDSREGEGTTITIRLPLTLAIIEGFCVGVGRETYVIPLDAVIECLDLPEGERRRVNGCGVINLRGQALPYLRLRDVFGLDGAAPLRENIVVVHHGGGMAGLAVDALHGESQAVIKPLGKLFHGLPGVLGSTILGNGRVALILDVPGLLREVQMCKAQCV